MKRRDGSRRCRRRKSGKISVPRAGTASGSRTTSQSDARRAISRSKRSSRRLSYFRRILRWKQRIAQLHQKTNHLASDEAPGGEREARGASKKGHELAESSSINEGVAKGCEGTRDRKSCPQGVPARHDRTDETAQSRVAHQAPDVLVGRNLDLRRPSKESLREGRVHPERDFWRSRWIGGTDADRLTASTLFSKDRGRAWSPPSLRTIAP